jgi:hypothetical protein
MTPPLSSTLRASASISLALVMMPRPSRSHCTDGAGHEGAALEA